MTIWRWWESRDGWQIINQGGSPFQSFVGYRNPKTLIDLLDCAVLRSTVKREIRAALTNDFMHNIFAKRV